MVESLLAIRERYQRNDLGTHAGALTYGAFLSLPPVLLLVASTIGFVIRDPAKQQQVVTSIVNLIPGLEDVAPSMVQGLVSDRVTVALLAIPGLVWAASGFAARLRHALGVIFDTEPTGLITGRFRGALIGVPLVLGVIVVLALPGSVSGLATSGVVSHLAEVLTFAGIALAGVAFFLALFRFFTPPCPLRWRNHLPGAIVATIGWLILQRLGALYVDRVIARGSALYGALGAIFGLLAFLYIATYVVLLAAELSAVAWERRNPPA